MSFFKAVSKVVIAAGAAEVLLNPKTRTHAEQAYLGLRQKVVTPDMQKRVDEACETVKRFVK